jgi:hypothetical protein
MVKQLSETLYVLDTAVLQLTNRRDVSYGVEARGMASTAQHVRWGAADNQPNLMHRLIQNNNQVRAQLESARDMIYGSGLGFFRRVNENGQVRLDPFSDARLEDWMWETGLQNYCIAAINQRVDAANHFTRFEWDPAKRWYHLEISDAFVTRIALPEGGRITHYCTNPYFGEGRSYDDKATERLPAFDRRNPEANQVETVTILHSKEEIPGQPFYAFPSWWCAQEWIELANLIPTFHKSGITNGYNIKYLIRMPQDYFDKEGNRTADEKSVKKKWGDFSDNLSNWLAGKKNVNKTMLVKYLRGSDGKMLDNVDVIPLKNEMSDDAYARVWEMAGVSIANSMGILPTLAGVNPGKGNDSGSQIRVMADYQQHFRTPVHRHLVTEPIQHALRAMGYRDVVPLFKEVQITTLDANPTGAQAVVNSGS